MAANGSTTGFTTADLRGDPARAELLGGDDFDGTVVPADGAYIKPADRTADHFGAVYNTAGMSGLADAQHQSSGNVYLLQHGGHGEWWTSTAPQLTCTYVQSGGTTPDNFTIKKQGARIRTATACRTNGKSRHGLNRLSRRTRRSTATATA